MNPTDQARKEARKKELKKNKKQRQMVRAAVLKGKDPNHLIAEMEKIDRMEYDVNNPPLLNEKVLKDKRKKLRETFARVLKLYEKEDPEQWRELRRLEGEYEVKRNFLMQYYDSVKHAQQVQVEDIPLPAMQMPSLVTSQIPLPSEIPLPLPQIQPHSILKKTSIYEPKEFTGKSIWTKTKGAPGVPPGPPPSLSDIDDDDDDDDDDEDDDGQNASSTSVDKQRKIRFADDNSKGDEEEEKDTRLTVSKASKLSFAQDEVENMDTHTVDLGSTKGDASEHIEDKVIPSQLASVLPSGLPPGPPPGLPPGPPPGLPPMMFRPLRPPPVRLPPGPPPGRPPGPPGPPPGLPPRMLGPPPVRLPPGPPPGIPSMRLMRPPGMPPLGGHLGMPPPLGLMSSMSQSTLNPNVLSAPPSLINRPKTDEEHKGGATIEAKPQIRNLSADVTRFTPTSLRIKREEKGKKRDQKSTPLGVKLDDMISPMVKSVPIVAPTKDDAYEQFMKEMEDLL